MISLNPRVAWLLFGGTVAILGCDSTKSVQPGQAQLRRLSLEASTVDIFAKAESYGPNGEIYMWSPVAATYVGSGWIFLWGTGSAPDSLVWRDSTGQVNLTDIAAGVPYNGGNIFVNIDVQGTRAQLGPGIPADLTKVLQEKFIPEAATLVLTAQPNPGFEFSYWSGAGNSSRDNPLVVPPVSGGEYVGVFHKLKSSGTGGSGGDTTNTCADCPPPMN